MSGVFYLLRDLAKNGLKLGPFTGIALDRVAGDGFENQPNHAGESRRLARLRRQ
jgi:hypothetical protein